MLNARHGHFTLGYCETSHSTQSKSVRDLLVAQSADSFLASSREQFYVSVSRGKETIRIYTDSRRELEAAVGVSSTRQAGIELAGFTKGEVGALVSDSTGSQQWRDRVRTQQAEKTSQSHVERLLSARKMSDSRKPENMDFRQFVAMQAALASADGRCRSKGHPSGAGKKGAKTQGKSFARPTRLSDATDKKLTTKEKIAVANDNKTKGEAKQGKPVQMHPRRERLMKGYEAAKARLGKVVANVKGRISGVRDKGLPKSNTEQLAKNAEQRQSKGGGTKAKTNAKVAQKSAAPPPPAPAPSRGK